MKKNWFLRVEYKGFDGLLDRKLEKAIGRRSTGSGFDTIHGIRDVEFGPFGTEEAARAAEKRAKETAELLATDVLSEPRSLRHPRRRRTKPQKERT